MSTSTTKVASCVPQQQAAAPNLAMLRSIVNYKANLINKGYIPHNEAQVRAAISALKPRLTLPIKPEALPLHVEKYRHHYLALHDSLGSKATTSRMYKNYLKAILCA